MGRALTSTLSSSLLMREAYKGNPGQQQMTRMGGQGPAMNKMVTSETGNMGEGACACICGVFVLPHDGGEDLSNQVDSMALPMNFSQVCSQPIPCQGA